MTDYPVVMLDGDTITDITAATLAMSLLGHVLFLKNQVPLPIMQLTRISNAKTKPRTLKQRQDLLNSFDTLSSHLQTTFSALSTAFARSRSHADSSSHAQAYLAFMVGPGIRTAKERVILGIDGIEKKIWGTREDKPLDEDDESNEETDDEAEEPEDSDEESNVSSSDSDEDLSQHDSTFPEVDQKFLRNAERLLSHVLATADANGKGMSSEIAPTQTHVLLRAPRRFIHPAWVPSQNIGTVLDSMVDKFLQGSSQQDGIDNTTPVSKSSKAAKLEGVWITSRMGVQKPERPKASSSYDPNPLDEDDDLIWWSWDGKLSGFADW